MKDSLPVVKGLIFDLDGTLLNSLGDLHAACNHALALHGLPARSQEEIRLRIGEGVRRLLRRAASDPAASDKTPAGDPAAEGPEEAAWAAGSEAAEKEKLDLMVRQMLDFYTANCCVKTFPYPGALAMLEALAGRGIPFAVLSNKMHSLTLLTVAHYFPKLSFAAALGAREGVPLKPDPATALEIAARLELAPAEIGFVGDTGTDMGTAVNAGMLPIGVTWGFRSAGDLLAGGARVLLDSPEELFSKISFG